MAYSGLADAYGVLIKLWRRSPTTSSPSRMPRPGKPWNSIPRSRTHMRSWAANKMEFSWDFAGGEAEFRKALELDPSDATAHQWFSERPCLHRWPGAGVD